jgi:hypothetical protein
LSIDDIIYIKNSIKSERYCDDVHGVKILNAGLANIMMFPGRAGYSISEIGFNFYNCLFDDNYIYNEK